MEELKRIAQFADLEQLRTTELARPLARTERDLRRIEDQLILTAEFRQAREFTGESAAAYASQLQRLDGTRYTLDDVERALHSIATSPRGEYATSMPSFGELMQAIEVERRRRTKVEAEAAAAERIAGYVAQAQADRDRLTAEWPRIVAEREEQARVRREALAAQEALAAAARVALAALRQWREQAESDDGGYLAGIA